MSFQNLSYLAFVPLVAFVYLTLLPRRWQNHFLLAASLVFYWCNRPTGDSFPGLWQVLPIALLGASCVFVWRMGLSLQAAPPEQRGRKLATAVVVLLAVLAVFKYFNLALAVLPFAPGVLHRLPFPLGISFYTFAALSYLIDVSRGDMPAEKKFINLAAFLSFFGTITAGPICRAQKVLPQLEQEHRFDAARTVQALQLFALGFFKKVAVADVLMMYPICRAQKVLPQLEQEHRFDAARTVQALQLFALGFFKKVAVADVLMMYVSQVFADIPGHSGPALLAATVGYTFYLYFDFVGYSQMARASALLLGLEIPENFKTPFFATNFSGFWSRWHISLSSWLQDYLFTTLVWADASKLPLLGRKISRFSPVFCVFCVFFVSGFWHGNTLPFVIWGLLQAAYRVGEELLHQKLGKPKKKAPARQQWAKRLGVFLLWNFSMVFFAMGSAIGQPEGESYGVGQAFAILKGWFAGWSPARFASESWQAILGGFYNNTLMGAAWILMLACTLALAFWLDWQRNFQFKNKSEELVLTAQKPAVRWALYYALVLFSFAGLVMQNGGFAGGSFAYGGF